jgi:hypothetical protein
MPNMRCEPAKINQAVFKTIEQRVSYPMGEIMSEPFAVGQTVLCIVGECCGCQAGRQYVVERVLPSEIHSSGWSICLRGLVGWADAARFRRAE